MCAERSADVKFLAMVRKPLERLRSMYMQEEKRVRAIVWNPTGAHNYAACGHCTMTSVHTAHPEVAASSPHRYIVEWHTLTRHECTAVEREANTSRK